MVTVIDLAKIGKRVSRTPISEIGKMHDCDQFEEGDEFGGEAERAGGMDGALFLGE